MANGWKCFKVEDALMCKVFAMTLRGAAQDWFHTVPSRSISSFKELALVFTKEYTSYRTIKNDLGHLFNLCKKHNKFLQDYIKRFKAKKANIKGLPAEHDQYYELTIAHSQTLAEILAIVERYTLWGNDRIARNRNYGGKRNAPSQVGTSAHEGYTKFTISIHQILAQVKDKPWLTRLPHLKGDPNKGSFNKYCAFHGTHRHDTANCQSSTHPLNGLDDLNFQEGMSAALCFSVAEPTMEQTSL
ncbi:unnamed protein product [Prunus armeniaca]